VYGADDGFSVAYVDAVHVPELADVHHEGGSISLNFIRFKDLFRPP